MKSTMPVGARATFVVALSALAAPALAQAGTLATTPTELPPVVVTATRTEVPVTESLAAITLIDRDTIERAQATDLAELLRFTAGLDIGRNGAAGQTTSVFIRGGESNHTLVLIDGVRVNPATSGGAALQNITPDMIERIEIVKGPRSTLYGSDAIGGVINVITRQATRASADLRLRAGADQTRDGSVQVGYGDAEKSISLFAQHLDTEGYPILEGQALDRGFRQASFNGRGSAKIGKLVEVSARGWNSQGTVEYFNFGTPKSQDFQNQVAGLDVAVQLRPNWSSTLSVSRTEDDIRQNDANFLGEKDFVRTVRPAVEWHNVIALGGAHRVSFGGQAARDEVSALSFGSPIKEERSQKSMFLQDEIRLGIFSAVLGGNLADYEAFGQQTTWNAELGAEVLTGTRLIAAAGTGFRAPDATDRFGFAGNPDLEAEEALNYELGLRQQFGQRQSVDLRAFQSEVDDLINTLCNADFSVCDTVNIDEYRNRGVELAWNYASTAWVANVTGIVQDPEDRSTDMQLLRRTKRSIAARVARQFGPHYLSMDVLGSAQRPDFGDVELGGYALVNVSAGLQLDPRFRLEARIENLLNKDYQTAAGFEQPGVGGYVTLRYGF